MKRMNRWLGIMMSVMLAAGLLRVPVYAAEMESTTAEVEVKGDNVEIPEDEGTELNLVDEPADEVDPVDDMAREGYEGSFLVEPETDEGVQEQHEENFQRSSDNNAIEESAEDANSSEAMLYHQVYGTCGDNLTFNVDEEGTLTVSGTGDMDDYYDGDDQPWYGVCIEKVIINEGVTSIGIDAFNGYCIGNCNGEELKNVIISSSVKRIGGGAFSDCTNLTSVIMPDGVTEIETGAFSGCTSLPSVTIPSSVTNIGSSAFSGCSGLTSITIENGLSSIGDYAFSECSSLTSVDIPEGVTSIGQKAFYECCNLENVTIPEGVTNIEKNTFYGCNSLKDVTLPSSITSIGECAFANCESISSITIPVGVESIGTYAFGKCSSLTSVTIPSSVTSVGEEAFSKCGNLTNVTIEEGVTNISEYEFNECSKLIDVTIPSSVTSIGNYAFYKCSSLQTVTIPNGVTSIGDHAFNKCSNLTDITIEESVINIGKYAFVDCESLLEVTVPQSVVSIEEYAFYRCSSLASVTIKEGVTSIGEHAFDWCVNLSNVTIPSSITSIGKAAFSFCNQLRDIYFGGDKNSWNSIPKSDANISASATVHFGSDNGEENNDGTLVLDPEFTCNVGDQITISATYKGKNLITSANIDANTGGALEFSGVSIIGPVDNGDGKEMYISFMVTGKEKGEYTLTLTASDGSKAETLIKVVDEFDISGARVMMTYDFENEDRKKSIVYSGNRITPIFDICVGKDNKSLEKDKDYTLTYKSNKDIGVAQCTVKGIGKYHGEFTVEFWIVPGKVKNLRGNNDLSTESVAYTNYKRGLDLAWDSDSDKSIAFEIQYSKKSDFSDAQMTAAISGSRSFSELDAPLERKSEYYVRIRTYKELSGGQYINGEWSDSIKVKAGNQILPSEMWGFENYTDRLSLDDYKTVFKDDKGSATALFCDWYYKKTNQQYTTGATYETGGMCYGMVMAGIAYNDYNEPVFGSYPELSSITESMRKSGMCSSAYSPRLNLENSIKYAYITQFSYPHQSERLGTTNNLLGLYNAVKDCQTGNGRPVVVNIFNKTLHTDGGAIEGGGHCILAVGIKEEADDFVVIETYDPNNRSTGDELTLYKNSSGNFENWEHQFNYFWGSVKDDSKESYIDFSLALPDNSATTLSQINRQGFASNETYSYFSTQIEKPASEIAITDQLRKKGGIPVIAVEKDAENDGSNILQYWFDADSLDGISVPAGSLLTFASGNHYSRVYTTAAADVSMTADDSKSSSVTIDAQEEGSFEIELYDAESGTSEHTEYTVLSGDLCVGQDMLIEQDGDSIDFIGVDAISISKRTGDEKEGGDFLQDTEVIVEAELNSDLPYRFVQEDETAYILGDLDKDGEYETVIINSDESEMPETVASGDLTDTLSWKLDEDGVLTIYGGGDMPDFDYNDRVAPWYDLRYDISEIIIEKGVTSIGECAFRKCENCNAVTISEGVRKIGDEAFENCKSLIDINWYEGIEHIGACAFYNCDSLCSVIIPNGVMYLGQSAFIWCNSLKSVTIPDSVNRLGEYVFNECVALTDVTLGSGMTSIPNRMFNNCFALEEIIIPEGVEMLGRGAFYNCTSLRSIELPEKLKQVYEDAFLKCSSLENVVYYGTKTQWKQVKFESGNTDLWIGTIHCSDGDVKVALPGKTTRGDMFNLANNVKVTWKEVPGAKYYKVYREGVTDKKETRTDPVIVTAGLIGWDKDPGLTNGHAYKYKIVASLTGERDSSGDSTLSYSKLMYRLKTVVIRSVKNTAPGKITVRYDKTLSGDSYVLQYCERQDMVGAKTKVVLGANNTSYVIGGLKKGKTYYISIRVRKKVNGIDYYTTFGVPKKIKITQ